MGKKYKKTEELTCRICNESFEKGKKLANHIIKMHDLKSVEYTTRYIYAGIRPLCPICSSETRYVAYSFKKYCMEHSNYAEAEAGVTGGKIKKQWNKGLTKETNEIVARISSNLIGEKNPFWGRKHSKDTLSRIAAKKRLTHDELLRRIRIHAPYTELLSSYDQYDDQNSLLSLRCADCDTVDNVSLFNIMRCWSCRICHPNGSKQQVEILNFVRSLGFVAHSSTRDVISPLELDVWVPEKNVAIEYHGLFWHSGGKEGAIDRGIHRKKMLMCRERGIKLIQVFSDEWREKREIVQSIISHALGSSSVRLNGRDCTVREITHAESSVFLDSNHISGHVRAKVHLGLFHPMHGLVGVVTGRQIIQKKWGHLFEIARMAFTTGTSIRGGASKLIKSLNEWALMHGYDGLLSYADLRVGDGNVYSSIGFKRVGESERNYWYTDGHKRFDRFKFRAQDGMSESEYAASKGVRECWGAVNAVFVMTRDSHI